MQEIICPNCGKAFTVDEANYASIVNQVKNIEFQKEIDRRIVELEKQHKAEQEAQSLRIKQKFDAIQANQNLELHKKENEIAKLNEWIKNLNQSKQLEITTQLAQKEQEITQLKATIAQNDQNVKIAILEEQNKTTEILQQKEQQIASLRSSMQLAASESALKEKI